MGTTNWQPSWWNNETHGSAWERAKAALKLDWEQTKNDFGVKGTRDLDQDVGDTVKQAAGTEPVPWDQVEGPLAFGVGAQAHYAKTNDKWDDKLETTLKEEWEKGRDATRRGWGDVKHFVRRGYESAKS